MLVTTHEVLSDVLIAILTVVPGQGQSIPEGKLQSRSLASLAFLVSISLLA